MQTMRNYITREILRLSKKYPFLEKNLIASGQEPFSTKSLSKKDFYDLIEYYRALIKIETHKERDIIQQDFEDYLTKVTFTLP